MESLYNIVEMSRMNKSQIQNGGDELRYQADRMAAKARKLRRAGKEKEAMKALEEAAKLREQAANWKPDEEFDEFPTKTYLLSWTRSDSSFFSKPIHRTYDQAYCFRELWEEKFDMLNDYLKLSDYKFKEIVKWDGGTDSNDFFAPKDIDSICKLLGYYGEKKTRGDWVTYYWKEEGTVDIQVLKSDRSKWRFKGEKNWREMPKI